MTSTLRSVLVCGPFGSGRTGDEATLAVLLDDLRLAHPSAEPTVVSEAPAATWRDHRVATVPRHEVAGMIESARRADLIVLTGAEVLSDQEDFDPAEILTERHRGLTLAGSCGLLAHMTGTPLALYAVGIGPLSDSEARRHARVVLHSASAVTVSDHESAGLASDIGVEAGLLTVTAHPAWRAVPASPEAAAAIVTAEQIPAADRTIVVCPRPSRDADSSKALAAVLDQMVEDHEARVVLLPFHRSPRPTDNDAAAALAVMERMRNVDRAGIVWSAPSPAEAMAIIAEADLVVAMRPAAAVFAAATSTPIVGIGEATWPIAADQVAANDGIDPDQLAEMATSAMATGGARLTGEEPSRAAENRGVLTRALALDPPGDPDTARVIADLALARAGDRSQAMAALASVRRLEIDHRHLRHDHDTVLAQKEAITGSRAVQLIDRYWALRARLDQTLQRVRPRPPRPRAHSPEVEEFGNTYRAQLRSILDRHGSAPGVVVFPPGIGWRVTLFQRPQQMALAFARLGYLVLYGIDPNRREGIRGFEPQTQGVYLMSMPEELWSILREVPQPIAMTYLYNFEWARRHLTDPRVVFEHIDELEVFDDRYQIEMLRHWYTDAVSGADLVVASALNLLDGARRDRPDAILCPNAVDYDHFTAQIDGPAPEDLEEIASRERPLVGYYGAMAKWVDFDLVRATAQRLPDHEFVFIGPDYDGTVADHPDIFDLPNVRWLGVKDYEDLPAYLSHFDVATIPFQVNEVTHAVSPVKLFEYMAAGKPVVTPPLRECMRYPVVRIAEGVDGWVEAIRTAIAEGGERSQALRRTARANTWDVRAASILDALARQRGAP